MSLLHRDGLLYGGVILKKMMYIGGFAVVAILLISLLFYRLNTKEDLLLLTADSINQDVIDNTKAIIYFSTTADQDFDNRGVSYAVFVQKDHTIKAFPMNGLELGSIALGDAQILLEDKNSIHIVDDEMKQFQMDAAQYTGERTGYLPKQDVFFSIYNTGFNADGYQSDIRYGNFDKIEIGSIPHYIVASGVYDSSISILTQDFEKNLFTLQEVVIGEDVEIKEITSLQNTSPENMQALAPILADEAYYYFILSTIENDTSETVGIYRIEKATLKQDYFEFIQYENTDLTATIPYNYKNSATIHEGKLYFINGLGQVYSFDLQTNEVIEQFEINNASKSKVRNNEETYFFEDHLYVLRYQQGTRSDYSLETYSLQQGKRIEVFDVLGLDKVLNYNDNKRVYSYDLKVLLK